MYIVLHNQIRAQFKKSATMEDVKKETGSILTEINEATERNVIILEDTIQKAREVQKQIEKSMALYKTDAAKPQTYNHLKKNPLQNAKSIELNFEPTAASEPEVPDTNSVTQQLESPSLDKSTTKTTDINSSILSMYRSGVSVSDIASKYSKTTSEVELIISLYGDS